MLIALLRGLFDCIRSINISNTQERSIFIIILLFYTCTGKYVKDNHFDYLVFSQRWLPSSCIEYVEKNVSVSTQKISRFCLLPKNFKTWRIHGLWPTQDKSLGPFYCNRSIIFDIKKVQPIESQLELYWPNIEGGKTVDSLWQHEWDKHGTCAAQLEALNGEMKYFGTTIKLYETYNMQTFLNISNVISNEKSISVPQLFYMIKNAFGKMPQIHCIQEVKTKQPYLSEIRLCFSRNLELIDCKDIHRHKFNSKWSWANSLTNCPMNRNVILPDNIVPNSCKGTVIKNYENLDYFNKLYNSLLIIRFLQWVSI